MGHDLLSYLSGEEEIDEFDLFKRRGPTNCIKPTSAGYHGKTDKKIIERHYLIISSHSLLIVRYICIIHCHVFCLVPLLRGLRLNIASIFYYACTYCINGVYFCKFVHYCFCSFILIKWTVQ